MILYNGILYRFRSRRKHEGGGEIRNQRKMDGILWILVSSHQAKRRCSLPSIIILDKNDPGYLIRSWADSPKLLLGSASHIGIIISASCNEGCPFSAPGFLRSKCNREGLLVPGKPQMKQFVCVWRYLELVAWWSSPTSILVIFRRIGIIDCCGFSSLVIVI